MKNAILRFAGFVIIENPGFNFSIGKNIDPADFKKAVAAAPIEIAVAYERMKNLPEYELYDLKMIRTNGIILLKTLIIRRYLRN